MKQLAYFLNLKPINQQIVLPVFTVARTGGLPKQPPQGE
jgi:hypothetical protein